MGNTNTGNSNLSTTDAAKAIRKALRAELGITARQVSVRSDCYSLGSSLRLTIKDSSVSLGAVKAIAFRHERVHRCEATGEVLCGGNRHVFVGYASSVFDPIRDRIAAMLPTDGSVVEIAGFRCNRDQRGTWIAMREGHRGIVAHFPESLAQQLASQVLDLDLAPALDGSDRKAVA